VNNPKTLSCIESSYFFVAYSWCETLLCCFVS